MKIIKEGHFMVEAKAEVILKKGEGRLLKSGAAWIFDNEIDRIAGPEKAPCAPESEQSMSGAGDIVRVKDFDGYQLGYGFYNPRSKIRVRMLSRYGKDGITPAFLRRRVQEAWDYRKAVIDTSSCRLVFGEADFLPGLTIDKFEDILVVESLALGTERLKLLILKDLVEILAADGVTVRGIYERSDAKVRELEGIPRTKGFIGPEFDPLVPIIENGIRYIVDVKDGQKTGFFLDQKENRAAVARLVRKLAPGEVRVLDCFTHTGSFGLNAAAAGASSVLSVDASGLAIEQACENAKLNGLEDRVRYQTADVFELLPQLEKEGERYDLVILDPPAFTKSRSATKNAVKGYREINLRGMRLVKNGGFLATCSCSHFMTEELFARTLQEAARGARRRLRQVEFRTQGPDHPILWGDDESYYLKFYIFQVMEEL
jgi:23S rRNA (cytosine1962-C5)-methyltransferase